MATEKVKMLYSIDEILGLRPSNEEIEAPKTHGTPDDPTFSSPVKRFSLGLRNDRETSLANILEKRKMSFIHLSDFLDFLHNQQSMLFNFMMRVIDSFLSRVSSGSNSLPKIMIGFGTSSIVDSNGSNNKKKKQ